MSTVAAKTPMTHFLWDKLQDFRISQGDEDLTFSKRLARENGWSLSHAGQVYQEYLRFVYLAVAAGHPVTPSEDVDQAWHLHLCYSRSYWQDLCEGILQKPLHHGPTRGGHQEGLRFHEQYQRTLESYRNHFGEEPPADIWPVPAMRFGPQNRYVRVNLNESFVLPRKAIYLLGAIFSASFLLSGCFSTVERAMSGYWGNIVIVLLGVLILGCILYWLRKHAGKSGCGGGCGGGSGCGGRGCGNDGGGGCGGGGD